MILVEGLINDNSISGTAFAFFTALIGGVTTVIVQQLQIKQKAKQATDAAEEAKIEAQKAGTIDPEFTRRVDRKLSAIITVQSDMERSLRDHLEWHLKNDRE